jgi:hypothetical protein
MWSNVYFFHLLFELVEDLKFMLSVALFHEAGLPHSVLACLIYHKSFTGFPGEIKVFKVAL